MMVTGSLLDTLARIMDRVFRFVSGRPPRPPEFDGLLQELFAVWPEDEHDLVLDGRREIAA